MPIEAACWQGKNKGKAILRGCAGPGLLPGLKLRRPDLVAREIAFMQAEKLVLGDLSELLTLGRLDILIRP